MCEDAPRRLETGGHQHRGPVHRVETQDVLAHQVVVDGPPLGETRVVGRVPHRRAVVEQRVGPHVRNVLRVPRERNAPVDRRATHREILEATPDETEHLVHPRLGLHRVGMLGVIREQAVGVARQLEEVVLLDDVLDRPHVDRTIAVDQLVLRVVRLARDAIEALVGSELDVARVVDRLQELLHRRVMARLGGADEVVVGDVESVPGVAEMRRRLVDQFLGRDAPRFRGALHLQAVLVGAGQEEDLVAPEPAPTGEHVAGHRRVGVADVGDVVHVVNRSGDVEAGHGDVHSARPCPGSRRSTPGGRSRVSL